MRLRRQGNPLPRACPREHPNPFKVRTNQPFIDRAGGKIRVYDLGREPVAIFDAAVDPAP